MSDTPKTDSNCFELEPNCYGGLDKVVWGQNIDRYVCVEFARELERDLTYEIAGRNHYLWRIGELQAEIDKLREALKWAEPYVPKRADCETRRMIESLLPNV
jgi:hypothetical protein